MTPEQEKEWREEFEVAICVWANGKVCLDKNANRKYFREVLNWQWEVYLSARKKAQEEFEKLHSFCLHYQLYIHDILHSVNIFKSFHELRKGAHAYAISMDRKPTWDYQDIENADYFKGLKSYIEQLKKENGILRRAFNKIRNDIKSGEHIDANWITNAIQEEITHPAIESSLRLLASREKEISQLKEELKRERSAVDFYAKKDHWFPCYDSNGAYCGTSQMGEPGEFCDYEDNEGSCGKLARQTQQQRRTEL